MIAVFLFSAHQGNGESGACKPAYTGQPSRSSLPMFFEAAPLSCPMFSQWLSSYRFLATIEIQGFLFLVCDKSPHTEDAERGNYPTPIPCGDPIESGVGAPNSRRGTFKLTARLGESGFEGLQNSALSCFRYFLSLRLSWALRFLKQLRFSSLPQNLFLAVPTITWPQSSQ